MTRYWNLLLSILCVGLLVALAVSLARTISGESNVIRIAHDSKENSPLHQAMLRFKEEVEAQSQGVMRVEIYPSRQLGDVKETTELVRQGNVHMTVGASVLLTSVVPEFNVLDLFYLFRDTGHAHRALDSEQVGGVLLEAMSSKGFHGIGFMEVGFRSITSNARPVVEFEDIAGLKIRAASNPTQIAAWKAVDAAPTPLSWSEIFTSLEQGLIDSQESAIYSIYAERFFEAQHYLSFTDHIYTNYVWFSNQQYWDGLDQQSKDIIQRAAVVAIEYQRQLADSQNNEIIGQLVQHGMQVNTVSQPVRNRIKQAMNGAVRDELRQRTGPELFDRVMSAIERQE